MASKQLTARVRLNTSQAEKALERLNRKINTFNNAINKAGTNNQVDTKLRKSDSLLATINSKVKNWASSQRGVNTSIKSTNSLLATVGSRLKSIASTYLGIMGARALIGTSDIITASENKLNYTTAQMLGSSGLTLEGEYNDMVFNETQEAMDKMYASSQRVRMGYTDMMANVSKSMALAGDSFKDNIDNTIRFQEIMAEAYAVGGASAQEMRTSMYQMIQALGSGILAGDELRSVREGAPLAYQAIEKFIQGVYDSEESLKELASQGKVTSDLVVAAIMSAGDKMDDAFSHTNQTFGQTWDQIKNAATYPFKPVSKMLNDMLNDAIDNGMIKKIESMFTTVSKVLQIVMKYIQNAIEWIADNWNWLKNILIAGLILLGSYLLVTWSIAIAGAIKSAIAWAILHWKMLIVVAALATLIYAFYLWKTGAIDTCTAIAIALLAVAAICFLIFGWQVALIVALIALVVMFFEEVCYYAGMIAAVIVNILSFIWNVIVYVLQAIISGIVWCAGVILDTVIIAINIIIAIINFLLGSISWVLAEIYNIFVGCVNACLQAVYAFIEPFIGIIEFILNACNGGFNSFGDAVANLIGQIISWFLSLGKVVTKIIDAIFGTDWTGGLNSLQDSVLSWGKNEESITISREAPELKRIDATDAFMAGSSAIGYLDLINPNDLAVDTWDAVGGMHTDYVDPFAWADTAGNWGAGITDAVNAWGSKFQNANDGSNKLDEIGKALGLDFSSLANGFPTDQLDPTPVEDLLNDIKDNTDSISDTMDLENDDLDYLRKLAEMEWRNEFTTAEIKVDMTNNNTVNGERDLDGIVAYLSDVLLEEMSSVAYGVHY